LLNTLDIFLLLVFSFFIVSGFTQGLLAQLIDLAGFFIALYLAYTMGGAFALFLLDFFDFVPDTFFSENSLLGYYVLQIAGFILVYFLVRLAFALLKKALKVATDLPVIGTLNALGGALVGGLKGLLLLVIVVSIGSHIPSEGVQGLLEGSVLSALTFSYLPVIVELIRDVISLEGTWTV
jgi:uncharacterized membrane protein required for colicin V production